MTLPDVDLTCRTAGFITRLLEEEDGLVKDFVEDLDGATVRFVLLRALETEEDLLPEDDLLALPPDRLEVVDRLEVDF